jgi:hypothetical protein
MVYTGRNVQYGTILCSTMRSAHIMNVVLYSTATLAMMSSACLPLQNEAHCAIHPKFGCVARWQRRERHKSSNLGFFWTVLTFSYKNQESRQASSYHRRLCLCRPITFNDTECNWIRSDALTRLRSWRHPILNQPVSLTYSTRYGSLNGGFHFSPMYAQGCTRDFHLWPETRWSFDDAAY